MCECIPTLLPPNGDQVNDATRLSFDVREVVARRPLQVALYDLSGHGVQTLATTQIKTGAVEYTWDGRRSDGGLVPPGVYIYRIRLDTDEGPEEQVGTIAVAY